MTPEETQKQLEIKRGLEHIQTALDEAKALREGLEKLHAQLLFDEIAERKSPKYRCEGDCDTGGVVADKISDISDEIKKLLGKEKV